MSVAAALFAGRVEAAALQPTVFPIAGLLGDAVAALAQADGSCLLAVDADGRLAGIMTERDVTRRVTFRLSSDAPVAAAMTSPVHSVAAGEYLYRAVARMRRHGIRHLPVVDAAGRPVGLIDHRTLMRSAAAPLLGQIDRLGDAAAAADLAGAKAAQAGFVRALFDEGVPGLEILAIVNEINRDFHRRALAAAEAAVGAPPAPYTLVVMGSLGRGESLLAPDQDNGFMLPDSAAAAEYFAALAVSFTDLLATIGFPYCKGKVMATNPQWRKPAKVWTRDAIGWIARRSPEALLNADIFFDFAHLAGPPEPVLALRREISAGIARTPAFLAMLAEQTFRTPVALRWLGGLDLEDDGRIDLKLRGLLPLVACTRLYALRAGLAETGTLARLAALRSAGDLPADEGEALAAAFEDLVLLILRQQVADAGAGAAPGNRVAAETLGKLTRQELVERLRAIERFTRRARADFTGRVI